MKVVLAHGVFDIMHVGHVQHLYEAAAFGDFLIVSVLADRFVKKGRPVYMPLEDRLIIIQALEFVDLAVPCHAPGPQRLLQALRPHIYVRGSEYVDQSKPEYAVTKHLGIEVGFTQPIEVHTSDIIAKIRRAYEPSS